MAEWVKWVGKDCNSTEIGYAGSAFGDGLMTGCKAAIADPREAVGREGMRYNEEAYFVVCGCRSVGECSHNAFAWKEALDALVDAFAIAMKQKLVKAALDKDRSGWDDPEWTPEQIMEALKNHVDKGDPVDIANLAAFYWNRQRQPPQQGDKE